jgi:L-asparagine oxygenase
MLIAPSRPRLLLQFYCIYVIVAFNMTHSPKPNSLKPPVSGEVSGFAEVVVGGELAGRLSDASVGLPQGLYDDSFERRGNFLAALGELGAAITSSELGSSLDDLKDGTTISLTIEGLPRDPDLPASPGDGGVPVGKHSFVSEGIALAMAQHLGVPSMVVGEKREALVHQITPVAGREQTQSNEGAVGLMLHQDLAPNADVPSLPYADFMPDWLILTGLRAGSGEQTGTYIASLDEALPNVSAEAQQILAKRKFVTNPPDSFLKENGGVAPELPIHPILAINEHGQVEAAFDTSSKVRPLDPEDVEALQAIEELNQALTDVKREVVIEPGTTVIFNNRRVVHGRGSIAVSPDSAVDLDASKRWLQRVYVYDPVRVGVQAMSRNLVIGIGGGLLAVYRTTPQRLLDMTQESL